jgi:hypothetical protein
MKKNIDIIEKYRNNIIAGIQNYLNSKREDDVKKFVKLQLTFEDAVSVSILSRTKEGLLHKHQYRIRKEQLKKFNEIAHKFYSELEAASNFDQIHRIISVNKIKGIGSLTIYDIAVRIASYKGLQPIHIYLHAGTKKGLEKISNRKIYSKFIEIDDLPFEFSKLTAAQIEDFLCHYYHFSNCK